MRFFTLSFTNALCVIAASLCAPDALGQAKLHVDFDAQGGGLSISASELPKSGLAVLWKTNGSRIEQNLWKPVHAFPVKKLPKAALPLAQSSEKTAFFRLSWQNLTLPDQMVWIPPGQFQLGSPEDEPGRFMDEGPALKADVPHGFWMDRYEVKQKSYLDLMGKNPSNTEFSPDMPVNRVTWHEAIEYCKRLTNVKGAAGLLPKGYVYRLPTEAEWEYACRAGTKGAYSYGDSAEQLSEYGWWAGNSGDRPEPVGKLKPNPWGLYDMHGNLFEWCTDAYLAYPGGKAFSTTGKLKVLRGGAYYCPSNILRSACRAEAQEPDYRWILAGFRVVLAPPLGQAED